MRCGQATAGGAHLVRDPVADASSEALVQQHRLDGRSALGQRRRKRLSRGRLGECVPPKVADGRLCRGVVLQPDAREAARVREGHGAAAGELQVQLGEARRPGAVVDGEGFVDRRRHAAHHEGARHAEVEGRPGAAVQLPPAGEKEAGLTARRVWRGAAGGTHQRCLPLRCTATTLAPVSAADSCAGVKPPQRTICEEQAPRAATCDASETKTHRAPPRRGVRRAWPRRQAESKRRRARRSRSTAHA